jgi:poly-gamma-glutamate capsule biosynthesis protein CapA/YwtB (metallophosphatase superfamily)
MLLTDCASGIARLRSCCLYTACCLLLTACEDQVSCLRYGDSASFQVVLDVRDEAGQPIAGLVAELTSGSSGSVTPGGSGQLQIGGLSGPALVIVSAPGYLAEPVPLGRDDADHTVPLRLFARLGGRRLVVHSVGDVMFGRRFETPNEGQPLIPPDGAAAGAAKVVAAVQRLMAIADVRTINLETVLSERTQGAYPGKPFILRSRPDTVAGLAALAVNGVGLANNHSRDFLDVGIADTQAALTQAGLPFVGAARADGDPVQPLRITVYGTQVAMLAFTTLDGSLSNDLYPPADAPPPPPPTAELAFAYELRSWGYTSARFTVPRAPRRIATAWQLYKAAEPTLPADEQRLVWASLSGVYPELQDWVARRGHGGAVQWRRDRSPQLVQAAAQSADLVLVQLHGGYEFQEAPSDSIVAAAHAAIDAGADLVVCHHPHVLQGLEWYRGKLIAYSLGNFVFDQDFLATFSSVVLRTVWEGKRLLEARLVPIELLSYQPTPVTDAAAAQVLTRLWERSQLRAVSSYDATTGARAYAQEPDPQAQPAQLQLQHHTARVLAGAAAPRPVTLALPAGQTVALPFAGLWDPRLGLSAEPTAAVYVGRDLFGWGRFEEETISPTARGRAHWYLGGDCDKGVILGDAARGRGFLRLQRDFLNQQRVIARPIARVPLVRHRLYASPVGGPPLDPDASYSLRMRAQQTGSAAASLRIDYYQTDSQVPGESEDAAIVGRREVPLTLSGRGSWEQIEVPLDAKDLGAAADQADMVLFYLQLDPPEQGAATLDVDELMLIEWRPAARMHDRMGHYDLVRSDEAKARVLQLLGVPAD